MNQRSTEPFDSWLDAELSRALAEESAAVAPLEAHYLQEGRRRRRGGLWPLASGLSAAAGTNLALGAVVTVFAAGTGGAIAETVLTGSLSPVVWTEQVTGAVESCGSDLGDHNVASCAAEFVKPPAQQRVAQESGQTGWSESTPGASPASKHNSPKPKQASLPTPPAIPSISPSPSPKTSAMPTATPNASPSPSPHPSTSASPSPSPSPSPSTSPSPSPSPSPSASPSPSHTQSPSASPSSSGSPHGGSSPSSSPNGSHT